MTIDLGRSRPESGGSPLPVFGLEPLEQRLLLSASPLDTQDPLLPTSSSQDEVVAATSGTHTLGIDVSHFQNDASGGSINWTNVKNSGKDFVWIKATEGVDFVDHKWVENVTGANSAGLLAGGYHFATPYTGGVNDASAEATDFFNAVSPYLGDGFLRPALDLEGGASLSTTVLSNWVHDFMNTFSSLSGGIVPTIYMNTSFANSEVNSSVNIYDLWLARWPASPDFNNPPTNDGVWNGYDLWQYSDSTSVSGINGAVDGDVFFGDLNQFAAKYAISTIPDDHGDDKDSATVVGLPSTTAGEIEVGSDSDWFEVNLTGNTDYTFTVLGNGLASAEVRFYSSGLTLLATDTGPAAGGTLAQINSFVTTGDVYFLEVVGGGGATGGYDLAVQETDEFGDSIGQASLSLLSNASVFGGLQTSSDADFFQLSVTAGMAYDLNVAGFAVFGTPLADAVLTLYDAGGVQVDQASGANPGGTHAQLNWTAAASGTMYASVTSNIGSLGDYLVSIAESAGLLAGDLNGDGFVGVDDLNVVLVNWNQNVTPGNLSQGDATGEGFVGVDDLNVVLVNWNNGTPPVEASGSSQSESSASVSSASSVADESATVAGPLAVETNRGQRRRGEAPVSRAHTDRTRGLAIANWRASEARAFDSAAPKRSAGLLGLWESDDDA